MPETAPQGAIGTVFSRPFRFTEVHRFQMVGRSRKSALSWTQRPAISSVERPPAVKRKWIYVVSDALCGVPNLYAELWTDAAGNVAVVNGGTRLGQEAEVAPHPDPVGGAELVLPHTVNGDRVYYRFFVARARLSKVALIDLTLNARELLACVDLKDESSFLAAGSEGWFLPVLDPFTVAYQLAREYERACNELLYFTQLTPFHSEEEARRLKDRQLAYQMARLLKDVADRSPARRGRFPGLGDRTGAFVKAVEAQTRALLNRREEAADVLIRYVEHPLMKATRWLYPDTQPEYEHWFAAHARMLARLGECPTGRGWLFRQFEVESPLVNALLLVDEPKERGKKALEASLKSLTFVSQAWSVMPYFILWHKQRAVRALVAADKTFDRALAPLNHALDRSLGRLNRYLKKAGVTVSRQMNEEELLAVVERAAGRMGDGAHAGRVRAAGAKAAADQKHLAEGLAPRHEKRLLRVETEKAIAEMRAPEGSVWPKRADGKPARPDPGRVAGWLQGLVAASEVVNLWVTMDDYLDKGDERQLEDHLSAVSSVLSVASLLTEGPAKKLPVWLGARVMSAFGFLGAFCDIYVAGTDLFKASDRYDAGTMVGKSMVIAGTIPMLLQGGFGVAIAEGVLFGPVGLAVAALAVASGALVTHLLAQDELDTFLEFCYFVNSPSIGTQLARKVRSKARWIHGDLDAWNEPGKLDLESQMATLFNVLASFSVRGLDYTSVEIELGFYLPGSVLVVRFDVKEDATLGGTGRDPILTIAIDLQSQEVRKYIGEDPVEVPAGAAAHVDFLGQSRGGPLRRVRVGFWRGVIYMGVRRVSHASCQVWIDFPMRLGAGAASPKNEKAADGWERLALPDKYVLYPVLSSGAGFLIEYNTRSVSTLKPSG